MKLEQLSLFVENRPGQLLNPCKVLADAGIDILLLALADTEKYGILRVIVKDWRRAKEVLEGAGCVVNVTDVVAVRVASRPGGLAGVLAVIEEARINVEYLYAFSARRGEVGILIFRFQSTEAALAALKAKGVIVLGSAELENLIAS